MSSMRWRRGTLSRRAEIGIRFFVGAGWVIAGVGVLVQAPAQYQPGDIRGEPLFWPLIGATSAIVGAVILWTAIRDARRSHGTD
jgi:hypothetical protein